jgi:hypothetical protein
MSEDRRHARANPAKAANELAPFAGLADRCRPAAFRPSRQISGNSTTSLAIGGLR